MNEAKVALLRTAFVAVVIATAFSCKSACQGCAEGAAHEAGRRITGAAIDLLVEQFGGSDGCGEDCAKLNRVVSTRQDEFKRLTVSGVEGYCAAYSCGDGEAGWERAVDTAARKLDAAMARWLRQVCTDMKAGHYTPDDLNAASQCLRCDFPTPVLSPFEVNRVKESCEPHFGGGCAEETKSAMQRLLGAWDRLGVTPKKVSAACIPGGPGIDALLPQGP